MLRRDLVESALRAGGEIIRQGRGRPYRVSLKARADLATEVDLQVEALLRQRLAEVCPQAAFLGEESGLSGKAGLLWVVDPLDGTTNFVHGYPHSAISVALVEEARVRLGTVYDPGRDELYWAESARGATRNGEPIRVSACARLEDSLLATGPEPACFWRTLEKRSLGLRRDGCASLDLCYVASGRLEGFCEHDLKPWDVAAGLLILAEAGGRATDFQGRPAHPWSGDFLASNGWLHDPLLGFVSTP